MADHRQAQMTIARGISNEPFSITARSSLLILFILTVACAVLTPAMPQSRPVSSRHPPSRRNRPPSPRLSVLAFAIASAQGSTTIHHPGRKNRSQHENAGSASFNRPFPVSSEAEGIGEEGGAPGTADRRQRSRSHERTDQGRGALHENARGRRQADRPAMTRAGKG